MCRKVVFKIVTVSIWLFVFIAVMFCQGRIRTIGGGYQGGVYHINHQYGWPFPCLITLGEARTKSDVLSGTATTTVGYRLNLAGCLVNSLIVLSMLGLSGVWLRTFVRRFYISNLILLTACFAYSLHFVFYPTIAGKIGYWASDVLRVGFLTGRMEEMPIWVKAGQCFGIAISLHAILEAVRSRLNRQRGSELNGTVRKNETGPAASSNEEL